MAAEDERCGNAANYAYDTMIGLFSTCVFRPPFWIPTRNARCCIMKFTAPGDLLPAGCVCGRRRGLTELLDLGYDLLRLYAKKAFDYGARLA